MGNSDVIAWIVASKGDQPSKQGVPPGSVFGLLPSNEDAMGKGCMDRDSNTTPQISSTLCFLLGTPAVPAAHLQTQTGIELESCQHLIADQKNLTSLSKLLRSQNRYNRRLSHHGGADTPFLPDLDSYLLEQVALRLKISEAARSLVRP